MTDLSRNPTSDHRAWRSAARFRHLTSLPVRRIAATLLAAGLLVLWVILLASPFGRPKAQLVVFEPPQYPPTYAAYISGGQVLTASFAPLAGVLYQQGDRKGPLLLNSLATVTQARTLQQDLSSALSPDIDVAIFYLAAHGISLGNSAYLLCGDFDPATNHLGRHSLADLLRQFRDCPAKLKLLLLDAGQIDHDPRLGCVLNEFPRLLEEEVRRAADPNLWVLTSNQVLEHSHVCHAEGQSIFQNVAVLGLQGAADADSDQQIDLDELSRYVTATVSSWVREHTGGAESQTPRLIWGEVGTPSAAPRTLLPVLTRQSSASAVAEAAIKGKAKPAAVATTVKSKPAKAVAQAVKRNGASIVPAETPARQVAPVPSAPQEAVVQPETASTTPASRPQLAAPETAVQTVSPAASAPLPTNVPEAAPMLPPAPPDNASVPELLQAAWRLRDALESRAGGRPSPVDYAPHLWREFQERLLAYAAMYRANGSGGTERLVEALRGEMLTLPELLAGNAPTEMADRASLAERIAFAQPRAPAVITQPRSLALAAALAWSSPALSAARIRDLAAQLEHWTISPPAREEYSKWVASLIAEERDLSELHWAVELDALAELDWQTLQLALETRILAERTAAAGECRRLWVETLVDNADRWRLAGERQLLDRLSGSSDLASAQQQLETARGLYVQVLDQCELVETAVQLKNDLVSRAPSYVNWCGRSRSSERLPAPAHEDVGLFLTTLPRLDSLLCEPDPANLERLANLRRQLSALRQKIEVGLQDEFIDVLLRSPAAAGSIWQMELLLSTPLLSHEQRERLNRAVEAAGRHKIGARHSSSQVPPMLRVVTSQDLEMLYHRTELELGLARLVDRSVAGDSTDENGPQAAFDALSAAHKQLQLGPNSESAREALWNAYRKVGAVLGAFYRQLPTEVHDALAGDYLLADSAKRPRQLDTLARAERQLRLLPGFAAQDLGHRSPLASLRAARIFDQLLWQRDRLVRAANDAPMSQIAWLNQSAASDLEQAARIPGQPTPLPAGGPAVALSGPSRISLTERAPQELVITASNRSATPEKTWIVLQYDPALLEVTGPPGEQFYRSEHLDDSPATLRALPPSSTLRASAQETIPLRIVAKPSSADSARLIVKAVAEEQVTRHEIDVTLPGPAGIDLIVSGTPGTWRMTESAAVLQPFPNQITSYTLELINRGPHPKRVRVDLAEASRVDGVTFSDMTGSISSGRLLASVPELLLPSGGAAVPIEFPKPAAPPAAATPAPQPAVTGPSDLRPVIDRGLLLVITDAALKRSTVKRIEIAPLRPRSYLQPTVSYDPQRGRIEVVVRPKDSALMPPGGSKIEWVAEGLTGKMLLAGEIKPPDYTARLFAGVPPDPQRVVNVYLTADGFPRAFVYHVPCGAARFDIPVEEDLCQARIMSPLSGDVIRAPAVTLPVALQVDMPIDAFQRPDDRIEVGIDVNLDRDLEGERTTVLRADRQVQIRLNEAGPAGLLSLEAKVADFQVDLDAHGLQNARVGVLARAVSNDRTGWSPPVEVVLDGAAPRITAVDVSPGGLVTLGQPLKVSVLATDDEPSSAIARVEVALDLNRTGDFDPEVKPVAAAAEPGGRWSAPVPTDKAPSGVHPLLIRAVDRAGHQSDLSTVLVRIGTTDEAAAQELQKTSRVTGVALYAGQPQSGVTVTLDEGKVPPLQTDEQGRFNFPAVPAGKHKLVAAGTIRNRERRAEAEFTIEGTATQATMLRLTLQ